jgi:predicted Zn-dependent peptidase
VLAPGIERTVLASGTCILTERVPEARSVALGAYVAVGGRDEADDEHGASHFLEHLLFKGTETRSARDIARVIDAVGGEMNAYTAQEHTAFYARLPAAATGLGLEILTDVLARPALRPGEVDGEREVILEELAAAEDDPGDVVHTVLAESLHPGHPLGREVLGTEDSIAGVTRDVIAAFHQRWYTPANVVMVAAGAIDHAEVVAAVDGFLDGRAVGPRPVRQVPRAPIVAKVVVRHPAEQAQLALGWLAFDQHDPDRYPLAVANHALGGGMSSRLFQLIREERGLAYSVWSSVGLSSDTGSVVVEVATAPTKVAEVLDLVDTEVAALVADGITNDELRVAKGYLGGSFLLGLEDPGSRMARLARSELSATGLVNIEEHLARIRAVTADDVGRAIGRVLAGPRALAAVGPFDELPNR